MNIITIFLASSSELKGDRDNFLMFIAEINKEWNKKNIQLNVERWEYFLDSIVEDGLQSKYNTAVSESDIFVMLFFTKVGKYTDEEFDVAFKKFEDNKKPRIYTYFKDDFVRTGDINEEIVSMLQFKKKLIERKHYVTIYRGMEDLKWQFSRQLEMIYGVKSSEIDELTDPATIDSLAIERVCKLLSPNTNERTISQLQLTKLIDKTTEFGKNVVFQLAKVNRRSNRTSDPRLMARSIPVFEALIESNKRRDRHFYFGQLAYALKDKEERDWKKAEENFSIAIDIRGGDNPEYFYELNRAICRANTDSDFLILKPSCIELQTNILKDLKYSKSGLGNQFDELMRDQDNRTLLKWLNLNQVNV